MINSLKIRWQTFVYNYSWSDWVPYIDGWIPRFSLLFPFVGYLILVNDQIAKLLEFHHLTGAESYSWGLSAVVRLRLIYYALFFLGVSNFIYRLKKPYAFRFGSNVSITRELHWSYLPLETTFRFTAQFDTKAI